LEKNANSHEEKKGVFKMTLVEKKGSISLARFKRKQLQGLDQAPVRPCLHPGEKSERSSGKKEKKKDRLVSKDQSPLLLHEGGKKKKEKTLQPFSGKRGQVYGEQHFGPFLWRKEKRKDL